MDGVCKYFQCGFCKFGESCRKQHIKETCLTQSCTLTSCTKRHPKVCKYFLVQKICRFGEKCSYKHIDNSNQNDILELREKIVILENAVQFLTAQISELTEEVSNVKKYYPQEETENIFKCSHCSYTASSNIVLKRHITRKHKNLEPVKELSCNQCSLKFTCCTDLENHMVVDHNPVPIERNEPLNSSLILSLDKEERSENISNLSPSHIETISCAADPSPSSSPMDSPPPSSIPKQKCASNQCINKADNFFSNTTIFKINYKNIFICDACTRFIPLKQLKKNPPIKV